MQAANQARPRVPDEIATRAKLLFVLFLREFTLDGKTFYQEKAEGIKTEELTTLTVDFQHVRSYDENLADVISKLYYRVYPHLCEGVTNFITSLSGNNEDADKRFFVAFNH
jgi:DNA replication licensing factor MCM6